eukprot:TRINITY_DN3721_c0_g1_i1.p1 TRINITY_DN3721_c0_g1~~TRINITY_DN3721_c0_g1_i1.p1  ORF type:complete len:916 (+),score=281.95 TRINITY_DN3721_c0_g1_i1:281-2749(+)
MKEKSQQIFEEGLNKEGDTVMMKILSDLYKNKVSIDNEDPIIVLSKEENNKKENLKQENQKVEIKKEIKSENEVSKKEENDTKTSTLPITPLNILQNNTESNLLTSPPNDMKIQNAVGNTLIDKQIAMGYLYVNTGKYVMAIELFTNLIKSNPKMPIIAAHLGRGTALAYVGKLESSIIDFTVAIKIEPKNPEGWKRRSQANQALGNTSDAFYDVNKAIECKEEFESYNQKGVLYYKMKNYQRAFENFQLALTFDKNNKQTYNYMGLCQNTLGNTKESIKLHYMAISIEPNYRDCWNNLGQAYKERGNYEKSEESYTKAISIDENYENSYYLRGYARFSAGKHKNAEQDLEMAVHLNYRNSVMNLGVDNKSKTTVNLEFLQMLAIVKHGLGDFTGAIETYDKILKVDGTHVVWYNKEICLFWHHHLDKPLSQLDFDMQMNPSFKESFTKRLNPNLLKNYNKQPSLVNSISDVSFSNTTNNSNLQKIYEVSKIFGPKIQVNASGYMPNQRLQGTTGYAIIHLAQTFSKMWEEGKRTKEWRDFFTMAVKWRQFGEPNDPVWWVDLLSADQFAEGFGSHTPMITGQTNVVRYFPMAQRSIAIIKDLILKNNFPQKKKQSILAAKTCDELWKEIRRDFWVTTPCHSTADKGKILEGTRLTIQYIAPEGYELSIRTPGTLPRWVEYSNELKFVWNRLCEEIFLLKNVEKENNPSKEKQQLDVVSEWILTLVFYWYNMMPLSRGTAAVGFISITSLFLSIGYEIETPAPKDFQIDWEGILRPTPQQFIEQMKWMLDGRKKTSALQGLPLVIQEISTPRKLLEALNLWV